MTLELIISHYGPWFFLLYIIIKEGIPIFSKIADKVVPERLAKIKSLEERKLEVMEKDADARERESVAMEMIQKHLVIIQNTQERNKEEMNIVMAGVAVTNQALMVLLDRNRQTRKGDDVVIQKDDNIAYASAINEAMKNKLQGE